jgi:hypothetical protein
LFRSGSEGVAFALRLMKMSRFKSVTDICRLWPPGSVRRGAIGLLDVTIENEIKHAKG